MPEVETARLEVQVVNCMEDMCRDLFKEWLFDLNFEEKEVWLWNALVEMHRIRERRSKKHLAF